MHSSTYTTVSGDTWDYIAFKVYGNEYVAHILMQANPQHLNTAIFSAGVQLVAPAVEDSTIEKMNELPPWLN